jgi:hypothetical protein
MTRDGFLFPCFALLMGGALAGCGGAPPPDEAEAASEALTSGWSCHGATGMSKNPDGRYYITAFGCWVDDSGTAHGDSGDNCLPSCLGSTGLSSLCDQMSGPECERSVNYYAANADRFGCGTRLRVTNESNGKSVVVAVIDAGPACWVERKVHHWVIDLSTPANLHLYGAPQGYHDRAEVLIEEVADSTPLGPVLDGQTPPEMMPPAMMTPPTATCHSATLGRVVTAGTCVQARSNHHWYQCDDSGVWVAGVHNGAGQSGPCTAEYAL